MTTERDPFRSMLILAGLAWASAAFLVVAAVLQWVSAFESQRWAVAIISTVFAVIVLGGAVQMAVLLRRYRRQAQQNSDSGGPDGEQH